MQRFVVVALAAMVAGCGQGAGQAEPASVDPVSLAMAGGAPVCADFNTQSRVYQHVAGPVDEWLENLRAFDDPTGSYPKAFTARSQFQMEPNDARLIDFDPTTFMTSCELPFFFSTEGIANAETRVVYTVQPNAAGTDIIVRVTGTEELLQSAQRNWMTWILRGAPGRVEPAEASSGTGPAREPEPEPSGRVIPSDEERVFADPKPEPESKVAPARPVKE